MSVFKQLYILLYSVRWYMCIIILNLKSLCCSGGKSVNNCISARGVRSVAL